MKTAIVRSEPTTMEFDDVKSSLDTEFDRLMESLGASFPFRGKNHGIFMISLLRYLSWSYARAVQLQFKLNLRNNRITLIAAFDVKIRSAVMRLSID